MSSLVVVVISFLILGRIEALYEDQVGKFDWYCFIITSHRTILHIF